MSDLCCPTSEKLHAWAEARVTQDEATAIADHVDTCVACDAAFVAIERDTVVGALRTVPSGDRFEQEPECIDVTRRIAAMQIGTNAVPRARKNNGVRPASAGPGQTKYGDRFRAIRPHARGGLGKVTLAFDQEVSRQVALKEILPEYADDAEARRRFLREAEITGQLEHPGIVPIYSIGHDSRGRPYYAMRFVNGTRLTDEIKAYHTVARETVSAASRLKLRSLLNHFVKVCEAVQYAHQQKIVHRDIKPANIMLGEHGETLLVDWGLARRLDGERTDEPVLGPQLLERGEDHAGTMVGTVVGTLAYMSPEQAAGRWDELTTRSDVFSLGATLYHLLIGIRPYQNTGEDAWQQVLAAEFPAPQSVNSNVPSPLAAVCMKAMAADPAVRYPSARALAADVENWLADERVQAYTESVTERLSRFARRHRTAVRAGGVALIGVTLASIAAVVMINSAMIDRSAALTEAKRQLQIASVREYATHLAIAQLAFETHDYAQAAENLNACDSPLRGWEHRYLQSAFEGQTTILDGHTDTVISVAVCGDDSIIVSQGWDGTLRIRNLADDAAATHVIRVSEPAIQPGGELAVTSDGTKAVVITATGGLTLWDLLTGKQLANQGSLTRPFLSIRTTADDQRFAAATTSSLVFFDTTLTEVSTFPGRLDQVARFDISPDGKRLATGHYDGLIRIWDMESGNPLLAFHHEHTRLQSVSFDASGKRLVSCGSDTNVRTWDAVSGKRQHTMSGHTTTVFDEIFSPDGQTIASAGEGRNIRVWDAGTGEELTVLEGHGSQVTDLAFFADGSHIVSSSADNTVRMWNLDPQPQLRVLQPHQAAIASAVFSPDGVSILSGGHDNAVRLTDVRTGQVVRTLGHHSDKVTDVAFSSDGRRAASASRDDHAIVWDVESGQVIRDCVHPDDVRSVCFTPDGHHIVTGGNEPLVNVWSVATGERIHTLSGHTGAIYVVTVSADGRFIASGGGNHSGVRIWDADTGDLIHGMSDAGNIDALRFNVGRTILYGGNRESQMFAWDVASGELLGNMSGHTDAVDEIILSPDGRRLISGGWDHTIRFWDTQTFQQVFVLKTHESRVRCIDMSPKGPQLLSTGADRRLLLWENATH